MHRQNSSGVMLSSTGINSQRQRRCSRITDTPSVANMMFKYGNHGTWTDYSRHHLIHRKL
jgi:hypothetical protein